MKKLLLLMIFQIFISCTNEDHVNNDAEIMGKWNLTREIVIQHLDEDDSIQTKEVLHHDESIVYDFKKDNQLLIKSTGQPDLLMRYSCYSDVDSERERIQEYIDINATTFILSYSEGKLILDATQENGSILYFERN